MQQTQVTNTVTKLAALHSVTLDTPLKIQVGVDHHTIRERNSPFPVGEVSLEQLPKGSSNVANGKGTLNC